MKRIYGNSIIGIWVLPNGDTIYPNELKEDEDKFEWVASNPNYPNYLFPHLNGKPLVYDEEA